MKLSKASRKSARQLFQAGLVDGRLDAERLRKAAALVVERKPKNAIGVLKEIHRLTRLELARRHAIIESAMNLSGDALNKVNSDLRARYGDDLTSELRIVPDLLGGLRIQIGDDVFDGSVHGRIKNLEKSLAA